MAEDKAKKRIQTSLLQWFKKNKRDLPWRKTQDPYAIWVSEIMLQQTQVPTVIPYYQTFLKTFPTIGHLAKADLSKVLRVWEGLGYYSRARNLHRASEIVLNKFHGKIPDTLKELLSLPGIGRYTAGAILSIAFNQEAPILDGNVKRVLSRLFAISDTPKKTDNLLWEVSESLIPKGFANSFNPALMDLGSMICTPKDPQCPQCPLHQHCKAKVLGDPERYPSKIAKKPIPHISAGAAVIKKDGKVLLCQRPPKGLLGGLWEFPHWKINEKGRLGLKLRNEIKKEFGMGVKVNNFMGTFTQTYSHFRLTLDVYYCETLDQDHHRNWVSIKKLHLLPMSRVHRRIAERIGKEIG